MALVACRDCGKQISRGARICPNCGKPQTPRVAWVALALIVFGVLFIITISR